MTDEDLRARFRELRDSEAASAPSFHDVQARVAAEAKRGHRSVGFALSPRMMPRRVAAVAMALGAAAIVFDRGTEEPRVPSVEFDGSVPSDALFGLAVPYSSASASPTDALASFPGVQVSGESLELEPPTYVVSTDEKGYPR